MKFAHNLSLATAMLATTSLGTNPLLCNMSDDMDGGFSLADLADLDVSDVEEIRFESLPPGAFMFKVVSTDLTEKPNRDNEQRFIATFVFEVVEVKAVVKKGIDLESLLGKKHTENFYIVPSKPEEGIGRIRAFLTDIGLESKGPLKQIIDASVEHIFQGKITERPNRDDPAQKFAQLRVDAKKR